MKKKKAAKKKSGLTESSIIICKHCHKKVTKPILVGISLVCPHCRRPINN